MPTDKAWQATAQYQLRCQPWTPAQAEKFHKFRVRTYSTVAMIGGFILIIWMGHVPLMALIFTIQARSFADLQSLFVAVLMCCT